MIAGNKSWTRLGLGGEGVPRPPPGDVIPPTPEEPDKPADAADAAERKAAAAPPPEGAEAQVVRDDKGRDFQLVVVHKSLTMDDVMDHFSVSAEDVRLYNSLPSKSNNLQLCKVLRIPIHGKPRPPMTMGEADAFEMAVSALRSRCPFLGPEDARFYLEEHHFDIEAAAKEANEDESGGAGGSGGGRAADHSLPETKEYTLPTSKAPAATSSSVVRRHVAGGGGGAGGFDPKDFAL
jgi:hypothetical protein